MPAPWGASVAQGGGLAHLFGESALAPRAVVERLRTHHGFMDLPQGECGTGFGMEGSVVGHSICGGGGGASPSGGEGEG